MAREPFNRFWAESPTQFEEPDDNTWERGWEGGANKSPPQARWENWWHNRADVALRQIERNGAMGWHPDAQYDENALSLSSGNSLYSSTSPMNVGNDPELDDGSNWMRIKFGIATETIFGFFKKATQEEVNQGAVDNAAITPRKLRFGFSSQLTDDGYIAFPSWMGGFLIQWGTASTVADSNTPTPFPTPFPNKCLRAVSCDTIDPVINPVGVSFTNSEITVLASETGGVHYIAVGF